MLLQFWCHTELSKFKKFKNTVKKYSAKVYILLWNEHELVQLWHSFITLWSFFRFKLFRKKNYHRRCCQFCQFCPLFNLNLSSNANHVSITLKLKHILPPQRELQWNTKILYVGCDFSCVWLFVTQWTVAH